MSSKLCPEKKVSRIQCLKFIQIGPKNAEIAVLEQLEPKIFFGRCNFGSLSTIKMSDWQNVHYFYPWALLHQELIEEIITYTTAYYSLQQKKPIIPKLLCNCRKESILEIFSTVLCGI